MKAAVFHGPHQPLTIMEETVRVLKEEGVVPGDYVFTLPEPPEPHECPYSSRDP